MALLYKRVCSHPIAAENRDMRLIASFGGREWPRCGSREPRRRCPCSRLGWSSKLGLLSRRSGHRSLRTYLKPDLNVKWLVPNHCSTTASSVYGHREVCFRVGFRNLASGSLHLDLFLKSFEMDWVSLARRIHQCISKTLLATNVTAAASSSNCASLARLWSPPLAAWLFGSFPTGAAS